MSITSRLRKTAWIGALLLSSASAYSFVNADYQVQSSTLASPTSAAEGTADQLWIERQAAEADMHRRQLADMDRDQRLDWGQRVYRRSCINCHGVQPVGMAHDDPESFTRTVLDGGVEMPALGFKLSATEAQVTRLYVARCQTSYSSC